MNAFKVYGEGIKIIWNLFDYVKRDNHQIEWAKIKCKYQSGNLNKVVLDKFKNKPNKNGLQLEIDYLAN